MNRFAESLFVLIILAGMGWAQMPAPVVSPEVHPDKTVTFRLRMPGATKVLVNVEGEKQPAEMTKDDKGVWSYTSAPMQPDYYGYEFFVDGTFVVDPSTPLIKPNLLFKSSEVHVPGPPTLSWETTDIPHGTVHHHFYHSKVVGDDRDFYVYTPPNYDPKDKKKYPVLYLLHGFSDDASGWSAVGRANIILDNLINQGKAKPMLVVMPLGYGAPEIVSHGFGAFALTDLRDKNFSRFTEALLTEVIPQVESTYVVDKDRDARAIAGLSMGGAESLLTGLNHLDTFSWVGAFSSGGLPEQFDSTFPKLDDKANKQLHLLWIACGTDDGLIKLNRSLREWLKSKNINHTDIETPGAHTWMVWRRNLTDLAPLLFR
ncbi:MAG TPA: alpha/beta hydrolase-fold protein [Terriglobales bacterium]|nr:alpha/beta hydrolase-fold protein [Terriglobales bacterium]